MKKAIFVLMVLFAAGCHTQEKLLCRTWKLVDAEFDEATVNLTKKEKPLMIQQLRDSCLFVFNKDHTYMLKLPQRIEKGVWNFSKHGETLYTQNDHTGTMSKINVLSEIALDVDAYSRDGTHTKFVLAPVKK
jgi:hypothetical protein